MVDANSSLPKRINPSVLVAFFFWGCIYYLFNSVSYTAAQDILAGTNMATSTVFIAYTSSSIFSQIVFPNVVIAVPILLSLSFASSFLVSGMLMVAFIANVHWRLFGIVVVSLGVSYGETVLLSLTSFFQEQKALSAYSAGTGFGFMASLLYYTAMTTWICVSPSIALVIMAPISLLSFACYYVINKNRDPKASTSRSNEPVAYKRLSNSENTEEIQVRDSSELSRKEKLSAFWTLLVSIGVPMYVTFFSQYTMIQSVVSTLAYPSSPFRPRDHYQYYFIAFWIGDVIGRFHRLTVSVVHSNWLYNVTRKGLWALAFIEAFHLIFLLFESWYRFLPGIGIVLCLCFTAGLAAGAQFTNSLEFYSDSLKEEQRKFGMGFSVLPASVSILMSGFLSLRLEPQLKEHCMVMVGDVAYCITRSASFKDIALKCGSKSV